MHVSEWGDPDNPALVMWHGLARTGRDFDELAEALAADRFVLCPDTIGRGLSSWSADPLAEYTPVFYAELALAMLDHYGIARTDWIGTSLGGVIGIHLAAGAGAGRLKSLIINDIGPEIPQAAVERIVTYAADLPEFATVREARDWLTTVYAPFGPAAPRFWDRMAETSVRRRGNGRLTLHYDPKMVDMFTTVPEQMITWDLWQQITLPTHVIQGVLSDILPTDILERMRSSGPKPGVSTFADCGHAPSLSRPGDIQLIRDLLGRLQRPAAARAG